MKRHGLLLGAALCVSLISSAAPLTPDEALSRLGSGGAQRLAGATLTNPTLQLMVPATNGEAALYVFNRGDNKGFFVLSADDSTLPVLGYSDNGDFDRNNMPPALEYWLNEYSRQISFLRESGATLTPYAYDGVSHPNWDPIEPLIKTNWDQDAPYNRYCPKVGNANTLTGCVATSMAQVMKYYNYPAKGHGTISYKPGSMPTTTLTLNLDDMPFDWDNMIPTYRSGNYTDVQANAVAQLMQACGYSVDMSYSTSFSGTRSSLVIEALKKYFDYDGNMKYLDRSVYDYNDWAQMVYDNIKNIGPVIYDGTAPGGGHSFICDGYDGNGYFHFNWGWNGVSDGYYILDMLNPTAIGNGGFSGGFNMDQDAIFGIQPPTGEPVVPYVADLVQHGVLRGSVAGVTLTVGLEYSYPYLGWGYIGSAPRKLSLGVIFENTDDPNAEPIVMEAYNFQEFTMEPGYLIQYIPTNNLAAPKVRIHQANLEVGAKYKATFAVKDMDAENSQYKPVLETRGLPNYFYVTRSALAAYEVENLKPDMLAADDINLLSPLYYGAPVTVKAAISNPSDIQLSRNVSLCFANTNGTFRFQGDAFLITLDPGETIEKEWASMFSAMLSNETGITRDTELLMFIYDNENDMVYSEMVPVTMSPNPGKPTLLTTLEIPGATMLGKVYQIYDSTNIPVILNITVGKGYFGYPIKLHVLEQRLGSAYLTSVQSQELENIPMLNGGENERFNLMINFPNAENGKTYYLQTSYPFNGKTEWMTNQTVFKFIDAGVEEILNTEKEILFIHDKFAGTLTVTGPDAIKTVECYDLNGMKLGLDIDSDGYRTVVYLKDMPKGIVVFRAVDASGNTQSVKVML